MAASLVRYKDDPEGNLLGTQPENNEIPRESDRDAFYWWRKR